MAGKDKVCECCGLAHQEKSDYCAKCHGCLGTCDWRGSESDLQRRVGAMDAAADGLGDA